MNTYILAAFAGLAAFGASVATAAERPVVVELFTSQGCSSCPPADVLLGELAKRDDVLALAFHVDYWDRLGWKDPFSSAAATARQRAYARLLGLRTVYTPQIVVEGTDEMVGSDRRAVARAISAAKAARRVDVTVARDGGELVVHVGAFADEQRTSVQLVAYAPGQITRVTAGENEGRTLVNANIVRSVETLGRAGTVDSEWRVAAEKGPGFAVLVHGADGHVLGAAAIRPGG
ncbi:MAG: DUF1223 domain-containing protein [Proteobacteria bacterium]|nr:DUF1223 domain-containing protein [Pseudomonadota bacterium]